VDENDKRKTGGEIMKMEIKGKIKMDYGADNFLYIYYEDGNREELIDLLKGFDGKNVKIICEVLEEGE